MAEEKTHLFDKPQNVRRLLRGFYAICTLLVVADFVVHRHVYHPFERLPTFYALFGFIACVLLVLVATQMRRALMRGEDYYGPQETDDE